MDYLRRSLPPLDPLVAFEAASRHGSFTRAAQELALSQAAVSQRIRQLEDHLGTPLFVRANRRVQLTAAGRSLQHAAAPALRQIALASEDIRERTSGDRLSIGADQSIATLWLMPHLSRFRDQADQELSIRVVASDKDSECLSDDIELAILHGDGTWPGHDSALLFSEEVFPVCAPSYLMDNPPVFSPDHLPEHPLLELDDLHWDWMNWRGWLSAVGVHERIKREPLRINSYPLIIQEAKAGRGIALGWRHLIDSDLAAGHLVRPVSDKVRTDLGYYLLWPSSHALDQLAAEFRDWLIRMAPGR